MAQSSKIKASQRVLSLIALEKHDIFMVSLLTVGIGLLSLATPLAVQTLVNIVTMGGIVQPLVVVSIMLFMLLCLSGALYILEYYIVERIQRRVFVRTAKEAVFTAKHMQIAISDTHNPIELMNRFFDVSTIQKTTYLLLTNGLSAAMQLIIGSIVLMFYSVYFTVIVLIMLAVAYFIVSVLGHHAAKYAIAESYAKYNTASWLEKIAQNLRLFKFASGYTFATKKMDALIADYLETRQQHFSLLLKQNILAVLVYAIAGTLMMAVGGWLVMRGQLNLGQFVAAELIIFGVLSAFISFVKKLETYYDMVAALDKVSAMNDVMLDKTTGHPIDLVHPIKIELHQVLMDVGLKDDILKPLSISIKNGLPTAILVKSSFGKTYIADLIAGLRLPVAGHITVQNIDMRQLDLIDYRRQIALVSGVEVIEDSIFENIRLQNASITLQVVQPLLESLALLADIMRLPQGLETQLLTSGMPLTTQQLRLLMLVRALAAQPKLLIIDGLLDELDEQSVELVNQLLLNLSNCTVIVSTQYLHIAKRYQQIVELELA